MTKPIDPYSRVYWRVLDDERFDTIRADMRHFGSWTLMLVVADMAYPAPAFVPSTVPRSSLAALGAAGLIEKLPGGLYRVHGLQAERERRASVGTPGASARWSDRSPNALRTDSERIPIAMPDETRLDKKRKEETSTPRGRASEPRPERGGPMLSYKEAVALIAQATEKPA